MRFYWPIAKVDAEQRMVWGYASTEALDEQGEIVKREALESALADYMRFANIREMHRPSAIGIAREATIDDRGLYLAAKIVDDEAWEKVVQGVYKGFSIGGRVTARDPADRSVILGLALTEISVVDRPANPEAVFDCWKAAGAGEMHDERAFPFYAPTQIWACGNPGHHHRNKEEADGCIRKHAVAGEVVDPLPQVGGSIPAGLAVKPIQPLMTAGPSRPA
jgi:HK97 family phage prohead protease